MHSQLQRLESRALCFPARFLKSRVWLWPGHSAAALLQWGKLLTPSLWPAVPEAASDNIRVGKLPLCQGKSQQQPEELI